MCPLYIAGLIGPGDRKSVQPMAARLGLGSHDRLHHFVSSGAWNAAPLEGELLVQADRLVGGADAFLVIDDTALPKKGTRSVGVAPQYASALGKTANCQTLVSLTLARNEVPVPVSLRLFLPEAWTNDSKRLGRAGVPQAERIPRSKPEIALAELDRIREAGVRFGLVLADAGYGISASFRQALSARALLWAVGIPRIQKVFPAAVEMVPPARRPSSQPLIPATAALAAEAILEGQRWRMIGWRRGTCPQGDAQHQRRAQSRIHGAARAGGRRAGSTPARAQQPAYARRRGLARGRAPRLRRVQVLPLQLARRHQPEDAGGNDQGALGL
jgi:SRSO17 transposase